jgi:hypothetical protein
LEYHCVFGPREFPLDGSNVSTASKNRAPVPELWQQAFMEIAPARFRRNGVVHREDRAFSMRGLRRALLQPSKLDRLEIRRP